MFSENINIKTCKKEHNSDLPSACRCPLEGKIRLPHGKVHQRNAAHIGPRRSKFQKLVSQRTLKLDD